MLSGTFFSDIMICDTVLFIYSHLLNLLKFIYRNPYVSLERCNFFFLFRFADLSKFSRSVTFISDIIIIY